MTTVNWMGVINATGAELAAVVPRPEIQALSPDVVHEVLPRSARVCVAGHQEHVAELTRDEFVAVFRTATTV